MAGGPPPDRGDAARLDSVHGGSQGVSDSSSASLSPQVKWVDTATGVGVFATRPYQAGGRVLWEAPWVFAQSYQTWNTCPGETRRNALESISAEDAGKTLGEGAEEVYSVAPNGLCAADSSQRRQAGHGIPPVYTNHGERGSRDNVIREGGAATEEQLQRLRCCFGCGAPLLAFLREECGRLDGVLQEQVRNSGVEPGTTSPRDMSAGSTPLTRAPVPSTWDLIHRANVQHLAQVPGDASADASLPAHSVTSTGKSAASSPPYVTEVDVAGRQRCVYFCTPACEKRSLIEEGKRFVLTSLHHGNASVSGLEPEGVEKGAPSGVAAVAAPPSRPSAQAPLVSLLRYPTPEAIFSFAQHPPPVALRLAAWPTRLHVLSSLHSVARRCNERVWLLTLLLAKHQHFTLASAPAPAASPPQSRCFVAWLKDTVAPSFRSRLEDMLQSYAEGAMQLLSMEQRSLLKFSWHLLTWWWLLCCAEEYTAIATTATGASVTGSASPSLTVPRYPPLERLLSLSSATTTEAQGLEWVTDALAVAQSTAFPLQLYLQLYWMTNANVHMYVVASPLYTLWCRWLQSKAECGVAATTDSPAVAGRAEGTAAQVASSVKLLERLHTLFHAKSVDAAAGAEAARGIGVGDSLHAAGVALYDIAAKLNHSCVPNVCFQPTMGPVAASVVALRSIEVGEQLFTSYIRVEDFGEQTSAAAARRRCYLKDHYGFECRCPVCVFAEAARDGKKT
ncbi:hypothetical protein LSCM4_05470 [Leishmania orientalis]|uniref:SET domain-containing protein n=1 Tax=Leishmania orientalis TaxID=2249476 RepID=A0A836KKW4_9TRYP|nr:hypothetical protein LSCM4_05470 [Leishmania orientalis]